MFNKQANMGNYKIQHFNSRTITLSSRRKQSPMAIYLRKNRKFTLPAMSIIPSIIVILAFIYIPSLIYSIFLIPAILFIAMHYTDTWGFLKRLKYGIPLLIVLLLIQTAFLTPAVYTNPGTLHGTSIDNTNFTANFSPYSGIHDAYTINVTFSDLNPAVEYHPYIFEYRSGTTLNLSDRISLQNITAPDGVFNLSQTFYNLQGGDYYTLVVLNFTTATASGNVTTGYIRGPIVYSEPVFAMYMLSDYVLLYSLLGFIYIIFLLFSKSISSSQRKVMEKAKQVK